MLAGINQPTNRPHLTNQGLQGDGPWAAAHALWTSTHACARSGAGPTRCAERCPRAYSGRSRPCQRTRWQR
jgi:hypothetical protein